MALVLGPIVFSDFEIPSKIDFGGRQAMHIHKLVGGGRVIDTMGPDDDPVRWRGRFRGPSAPSRARALLALKDSGAMVPLMWGGFFFLVVVSHVNVDYENFREVKYSVDCEVVSSGGFAGIAASLGTLVNADLGALAGLAALL